MMVYEVIGITVLWIFLFGYIIVASIDFGLEDFSHYTQNYLDNRMKLMI